MDFKEEGDGAGFDILSKNEKGKTFT